MGMAGSFDHPGGGAPVPDAASVATIQSSIVDDPAFFAAFAEAPRATLADLNARPDHNAGGRGVAHCQALLARLNDGLVALDVARLETRRGLAGWFDSRSGRLEAFRTAYTSQASQAAETAGQIAEHAAIVASNLRAADSECKQSRDAIVELDVHIAAGRAWLADHGNGSSTTSAEGLDPVAALAHPLQTRLDDLIAVRSKAIARLPELLALENASHALPPVLNAISDEVETWRLDWQKALGMSGIKQQKVRPDPERLTASRAVVLHQIAVAEAEVRRALARRTEVEAWITAREARRAAPPA